MIDFQHITVVMKDAYQQRLLELPERGCEYSFTNLYLWGRQKIAFLGDNVVFFSQFNQKSVYPFPLCRDGLKETVELLIHDAAARGIPCRLTGLTAQD